MIGRTFEFTDAAGTKRRVMLYFTDTASMKRFAKLNEDRDGQHMRLIKDSKTPMVMIERSLIESVRNNKITHAILGGWAPDHGAGDMKLKMVIDPAKGKIMYGDCAGGYNRKRDEFYDTEGNRLTRSQLSIQEDL